MDAKREKLMKKLYRYTAAAMLALGMVACTEGIENTLDFGNGTTKSGYKLTIATTVDSKSRAEFSQSDLKTLSWEAGDALGLFIHDEATEAHVATNVRMNFVENSQFSGTISANPDNRTSEWHMFAYFPYNSTAVDSESYHEGSWLVKHASRQTQIDAHHSNYDSYAFFSSSDNVMWRVGEAAPTVTLKDRTAALRFLIKAGEGVPTDLAIENLEEVDIFVMKSSDFETKGIRAVSESDGIVPLSGHLSFNHVTGEYTPITGESRNYIEVDFLGASTRVDAVPFDIKITEDNSTYVWAVVPSFTLGADEVLVAIFNTASYKVVYAYEKEGGFEFVSNKLYNFKNVVAESSNIVSNDPIIHTNDYILGASATATTTGANNSTITYNYPTSIILTMEADLPIHLDGFEKENMTYYIRYGYCDYCGADGAVSHNGLDVPYSEAVEETVSWAHELNEIEGTSYSTNYGDLTEKEGGTYRLSFRQELSDIDFLKDAFNGSHDPVYQAYAVYDNGTDEPTTYYGHVVHIDMAPFISDIIYDDYDESDYSKTPFVLSNGQFKLNVPSAYIFNGTAPAPYYWVNTTSSLRIYRCDVSSCVNSDGSLTTANLEEAVAANAETVVSLPRLQNLPGGYEGFYHDINTNGDGYIRYRQAGGSELDLASNDYDDYNGAYRFVMQAYDASTMQLVWIRSEYFRLCDMKKAAQ